MALKKGAMHKIVIIHHFNCYLFLYFCTGESNAWTMESNLQQELTDAKPML